jgi:hypothetical protein
MENLPQFRFSLQWNWMVLESDLYCVQAVGPSHHRNQVPVLFQLHCVLNQTISTVQIPKHSTQVQLSDTDIKHSDNLLLGLVVQEIVILTRISNLSPAFN